MVNELGTAILDDHRSVVFKPIARIDVPRVMALDREVERHVTVSKHEKIHMRLT